MRRIMTFEGIKFLRGRKNLVMLLLFAVMLFLQVSMTRMVSDTFVDTSIRFLDQNITLHEEQYELQQKELAKDTLDDSIREFLEQNLLFRERMLEKYRRQLSAIHLKDAERYWLTEKAVNEEWLQSGTDLTLEQKDRFQRENAKITAIQEAGLPFEKDIQAPLRAWPFLERIMEALSMTAFLFLILLLVGDHLSRDFDDGSVALYHSVLRKREDLALYKGAVVTGSAYVLLLAVISLFFLGMGIWFGFGSPAYPVIAGDLASGYAVIPMGQAVALAALHFLFVLFFLVSLASLLGALLRHSLITIGVLILGYYGFTVAATLDFMQPFLPYIPLSQLNSYPILTGVGSLTPQISFWASIGILFGFGLLNTGMSRLLLKNRY